MSHTYDTHIIVNRGKLHMSSEQAWYVWPTQCTWRWK